MNEQMKLLLMAERSFHLAEKMGVSIVNNDQSCSVVKEGKFLSEPLRSIGEVYGWLSCYYEHVFLK
jgi:hypothetical protein